jgi:hypothetical protein
MSASGTPPADPQPSPSSGTNGHGPSPDTTAADIENVGTTMVQELTQLLGSWEAQALTLAERGVDPRPLLAALAQNLRTVADSLDGGLARSESPED